MSSIAEQVTPGCGAGGIALSVLFDFALFLLAFRVLTDRDLGWRAFVPGAAAGAVGWFVLQWVGGFYVARVVQSASATYGFFAVMLGLLSWMHVLAQWVVFAAEVNVVWHEHLWPRTFFGDTLRERDREVLVRYAKVEERHPEQVIDVRSDKGEPVATTSSLPVLILGAGSFARRNRNRSAPAGGPS